MFNRNNHDKDDEDSDHSVEDSDDDDDDEGGDHAVEDSDDVENEQVGLYIWIFGLGKIFPKRLKKYSTDSMLFV